MNKFQNYFSKKYYSILVKLPFSLNKMVNIYLNKNKHL